jgi:hypothetical protein
MYKAVQHFSVQVIDQKNQIPSQNTSLLLSSQICPRNNCSLFPTLAIDPEHEHQLSIVMDMQWFNLPGAKEAYVQESKLRWVNDANLEIPWINFYVVSAGVWDLFTLAFPDQAWIIRQLCLIDKSIDETLVSLERLVPHSCKAKSWTETSTTKDFYPYYQDPPSSQRQRELILHYAEVLNFETYDECDMDKIRLKTFRATCTELVETASLKERAKLMRALLSRENTTALLSVKNCAEMPIWEVRQEAFCRGLMVQKAMQTMREALGLEEEAYEDDDEEEEENNEEEADEEAVRADHGDLACGRNISESACNCDTCTEDRAIMQEDIAPGTEAGSFRCDLPVRGCSNCGTATDETDHAIEGEWTSVVDENKTTGD